MCGIAGYSLARAELRSALDLLSMCQLMRHRGPDDQGVAFINTSGDAVDDALREDLAFMPGDRIWHDIALGHRRFSIIDPAPEGHQPFWSDDRRLCLTFNGEIYNYVELRAQLEARGTKFRTASDTEVLLQAYRCWGTGAFGKLRGFWAIALYDAQERAVLLSRDPLGKAALYVARTDCGIAWASEIKALRIVAARSALAPREQAIDDFVRHGWRDLENKTFYSGIVTFPAGSWAWVRAGALDTTVQFWTIPTIRLTEADISPDQAVTEFRGLFYQAVEHRLRADVPLGFELSGGMDSSSIVAAAVEMGHRATTFTVKFEEAHSDEEPFARTLKKRYGSNIDYRVVRPPPDSFWSHASDYVAMLDEPFHAPNMFINFSIWRLMANEGIRVSLNGAAGDELLAGYSRDYAFTNIVHLMTAGRPLSALRELTVYRENPNGSLLLREASRAIERMLPKGHHGILLTRGKRPRRDRARQDIEGLLIDLMGNWRMNYWLRSGHQSAMAVPMEVRMPFLDVDLVDFAFRLPTSYLIRDGWHKWILRQAMEKVLPPEIVWRKRKMGFPFPIREWLLQSKSRYFAAVAHLACPWINLQALRDHYDEMVRVDPNYVWRAISVSLWWKRSVLGEEIP